MTGGQNVGGLSVDGATPCGLLALSDPVVLTDVFETLDQTDLLTADITQRIGTDPAMVAGLLDLLTCQSSTETPDPYSAAHNAQVTALSELTRQLDIDLLDVQLAQAGLSIVAGLLPEKWSQYYSWIRERSLLTSCCARLLALETDLCCPDKAALSGLLIYTGQLLIAARQPEELLMCILQSRDEAQLHAALTQLGGQTETELALQRMQRWPVDEDLRLAYRYRQADASKLAGAPALARLLNAAVLMSGSDLIKAEDVLNTSSYLTGICADDCRKILTQARQQMDALAESPFEKSDSDVRLLALLRKRLGAMAEGVCAISAIESLMQQQTGRAVRVLLCKGDVFSVPADHSNDPLGSISLGADLVRSDVQTTVIGTGQYASVDWICQTFGCKQIGMQMIKEQDLPVALLVFAMPDASGNTTDGLKEQGVKTGSASQENALLSQLAMVHPQVLQAVAMSERGGMSEALYRHLQRVRHEISNPLSAMRNLLYVIDKELDQSQGSAHTAVPIAPAQAKSDASSASIRDKVKSLDQEVEKLASLTRHLSRPTGKVRAVNTPTDVNGLLRNLAQLWSARDNEGRRKPVLTDLDADMPLVNTDSVRLSQIITNLIKNALEAGNEQATVSLASQAVSVLDGQPYVEIMVKDDGPGLSDASVVLGGARTRMGFGQSAGGRGQGLKITAALVESLGARLKVSSSPQRGTAYSVLIPCVQAVSDEDGCVLHNNSDNTARDSGLSIEPDSEENR